MNTSNGKLNNLFKDTVCIVLIILLFVCFSASALAADKSISARYVTPRGNHIKWQIRIPSPAPAAVIVTQYILPGSEIQSSSHPLSSYDKERGVAKWLLTSIPSGLLTMDIKISKPIRKKGEIHGEVLFKDASQHTTSSIFMRPRTVKKALEGC